MARLPTWAIILITTVLLFGGLEVASFLKPTETNTDIEKLGVLGQVSMVQFLCIGILVEILEALFWTVGFVELGSKLAKSPLLGAVLGVIAYSVVFHWSGGIVSILISGWIVLVLNASYLILRQRSRPVAIFSTVAQKIAFITLAAVSVYPSGA
jgi:hypothetical protein